jgi:hypothetical protein
VFEVFESMLHSAEQSAPRSWLDGALARFASDNDDLAPRTRALLDSLVSEPKRHARMINTLSLLEHMGSHKIMATQHSAAIDQATLKHVAEEAHHAFFMKRQAEKTAERALEYVAGDLLAPSSARMYFQRLEGATVRALGSRRSARAAYLYMSMIVEFRALWFYGLYEQALKHARHAMSLKRVLGEEQAHLGSMAERLEAGNELERTRRGTALRPSASCTRACPAALEGAA